MGALSGEAAEVATEISQNDDNFFDTTAKLDKEIMDESATMAHS